MGRWERSGDSEDSGGDQPPVPGNRLPAEGIRPAPVARPAEGTRVEQGNRNREGGREGATAAEDVNREAGRDDQPVSRRLFEQQAKIIDVHKERADAFHAEAVELRKYTERLENRLDQQHETISQLRAELAKRHDRPAETRLGAADASGASADWRERTIQRQDHALDRQEKRIERQDARIGKLEDANDRLRDENTGLRNEKTQLTGETRDLKAELGKANAEIDRLAGESSKARAGDSASENTADSSKPDAGLDRPEESDVLNSKETAAPEGREAETRDRRRLLPGAEAVAVFSGMIGGGEAVGTVTHTLTTGEQGLIGAGAALGFAAYLWGKKKWEDRHGD